MLFGKKTYRDMNAGPMVDIHCHVLPGVDDGAESILESVQMLRTAAANGITDVIVTPHYKANHRSATPESIHRKIATLQESVNYRQIPITLHPGNEIMYYSGVTADLLAGKVLTLAGTDHVLVEFKPGVSPTDMRQGLQKIWETGYQPVLAHVERYQCIVENPDYAGEMVDIGAKLQTNYDAVMGGQGRGVKKCLQTLLENGLIDYLGTDAHDTKKRTMQPGSCIRYLYDHYEQDYVTEICYGNGRSLLDV
jgi:protein-tyrosine phosphatase